MFVLLCLFACFSSHDCDDVADKLNECTSLSGESAGAFCTDASASSDTIECVYSALDESISDGSCASGDGGAITARLCNCNPDADACSGGGGDETGTYYGGDDTGTYYKR